MKKDNKKMKMIALIIVCILCLSIFAFAIAPLKVMTAEADTVNWADVKAPYVGQLTDLDGNTYLEISTAEQLAYLRQNITSYDTKNIELMNNIDLGTFDGKTAYWTPIPHFYGKFNGNGFAIKNMKVNYNASNLTGLKKDEWFYKCAGLFSYVADSKAIGNAVVENLVFKNCSITSDCVSERAVGIIAGVNGGIIKNCVVESSCSINIKKMSTTGDYLYIGGLVGWSRQGSYSKAEISNCSNSMNINISNFKAVKNNAEQTPINLFVGGIVGEAGEYTSIYGSHNLGIISSDDTCKYLYLGGVAGGIYNYSSIIGCYNNGNIVGPEPLGTDFIGPPAPGQNFDDLTNVLKSYIGGIVGRISNNVNYTDSKGVYYCYNTGNISGYSKDNQKEVFQTNVDYGNEMKAMTEDNKYIYNFSIGNSCFMQNSCRTYDDVIYKMVYKNGKFNNVVAIVDRSLNAYFPCAVNYLGGAYTSNQNSKDSIYYEGQLCYKGGIIGGIVSTSNPMVAYCYNSGTVNKNGSSGSLVYSVFHKVYNYNANTTTVFVPFQGNMFGTAYEFTNGFDFYGNLLVENKIQLTQYFSGDIIGKYNSVYASQLYNTNTNSIRNIGNIEFKYNQYYWDKSGGIGSDTSCMILHGWGSNSPTYKDGDAWNSNSNCNWWYLNGIGANGKDYNINFGIETTNEGKIKFYTQNFVPKDGFWWWDPDTYSHGPKNYYGEFTFNKNQLDIEKNKTKSELTKIFNTGVWAVNDKINSGYPILKELNWIYNAQQPSFVK